MLYFKRLFVLVLWAFGFTQVLGQRDNAEKTYWIYLSDKQNSTFDISRPNAFLSDRSIKRRERLHIPITTSDLPVSEMYVSQLQSLGAVIITKSRWLNAVSCNIPDNNMMTAIAGLPFVSSIEPVKKLRAPLEKVNPVPADLRMADLSYYGLAGNQFEMLHGPYLHDKGYKGEGMVIAVLDAGFTGVDTGLAFTSVWDKEQILGVWNFADDNDSVFISSYHGTWVLSIMAGDIPGVYVGAAPEAQYYLFRTEVADSEYIAEEHFWLAAAEQADFLGADIINSSLSYTTFDVSENDHTYADLDGNTTVITKAADMAAGKGILVCSSAGNYAQDSWKYIGAPADGDSVFTIGSVDGDRQYSFFSSVGPTADGRIKPDIAVQGGNASVLSPEGLVYIGSGTSFSSPLSAGASAILWQAHPEKTNMEIMQALKQSASQSKNPDNLLGWGIPDLMLADLFLSGFEGELSDELFTVFPNPAKSDFYVLVYEKLSNDARIEIFDINGKQILDFTPEFSDAQINLVTIQGLPEYSASGIYILRVSTQSRTETREISILH